MGRDTDTHTHTETQRHRERERAQRTMMKQQTTVWFASVFILERTRERERFVVKHWQIQNIKESYSNGAFMCVYVSICVDVLHK